jgi:hypothetical protein
MAGGRNTPPPHREGVPDTILRTVDRWVGRSTDAAESTRCPAYPESRTQPNFRDRAV